MTLARRTCARRHFEPERDARRFVYLLDEDAAKLFEVVAVRGMGPARARPAGNAAVKLLDVGRDLPAHPFEAVDEAAWVPIEEATALAVVEPDRQDG